MTADTIVMVIVREPVNGAYFDLIDSLKHHASRFGLVVRPENPLADSGKDALEVLEPFLVDQSNVLEWPGTKTFGDPAIMVQYTIMHEALEALCSLASRLYSWEQPALPEDLFFRRDDGSTIFGSVAHERHAFLNVYDWELRDVLQRVPALRLQRMRHNS